MKATTVSSTPVPPRTFSFDEMALREGIYQRVDRLSSNTYFVSDGTGGFGAVILLDADTDNFFVYCADHFNGGHFYVRLPVGFTITLTQED